MPLGLLGKKIGMTRIYTEEGDAIHYLATNQTYRVDEGLGTMIFADGFESGDLSAWSAVGPP